MSAATDAMNGLSNRYGHSVADVIVAKAKALVSKSSCKKRMVTGVPSNVVELLDLLNLSIYPLLSSHCCVSLMSSYKECKCSLSAKETHDSG